MGKASQLIGFELAILEDNELARLDVSNKATVQSIYGYTL
jgi:hypothetical protein